MNKENTGDKINASLGNWSFGEGVEEKFDNHVRKSVPGYDLSHYIATLLSDPFLRENSSIVDIGCSTGTFLRCLENRHKNRAISYLGLDSQSNMIEKAKSLSTNKSKIQYSVLDIIKDDLPNEIDMISSFYTLQFIPPAVRQIVVNKIFNSLNWGGGFFLFEKVRAPDARFQDYINHAFLNFKLQNFKPDEVFAKSNSLIGVMEPFSSQGNIDLLKRAGFKDITTVSKILCFEGFLAIK